MLSTDELRVVRVYRAFSTAILMCLDRGLVVRHPSVIAAAVADPQERHFSRARGLDYDFFLQHFASSPEQIAEAVRQQRLKARAGGNGENEEGNEEAEAAEAQQLPEVEPNCGAWYVSRGGMRLTCAYPDDGDDGGDEANDTSHNHSEKGRKHDGGASSSSPAASPGRGSKRVKTETDGEKGGMNDGGGKALVKSEAEETPANTAVATTTTSGTTETKKRKSGRALVVVFTEIQTLRLRDVVEIRQKVLEKRADALVIVTAGSGTFAPQLLAQVGELSARQDTRKAAKLQQSGSGSTSRTAPHAGSEGMVIQLFNEAELAQSPLAHETVPRHIRMTPAAAARLLREKHLSIAQLPRMLADDIVARYLGAQRGDVMHIVRENAESGPYDMYRQVI